MPSRIARQAVSFCHLLRAIPCVGLAAFALIFTSDTLQTVVANGDTRSITLQHTHRDDEVTVAWTAPISERAEIRREVVVLYDRACAILGVEPRPHE